MSLQARQLGQLGLILNAAPSDLPPNAWTDGNNCRFDAGKVVRAPALRTIDSGLLRSSPAFVMPITDQAGVEHLILANNDGYLTKWSGDTTETDVTPLAGFAAGVDSRAYTGCALGNVFYVNRPDRVPYGMRPTDTEFVTIPAWDSTWRCHALRVFGDYLVALNVVKGATSYPQLVKWSNATLINSFPDSFDHTDPTKLAGENTVSELRGPLIDGHMMRGAFILYGQTQCFIMEQTGDNFVFSTRQLFDDGGVIAPNCVVDVEGVHYVFGKNDIYKHDGNARTSISDSRVKEWVFKYLDLAQTDRFFAYHDQFFGEVVFCFISSDPDAGFQGGDLPNRAVAYNYENDTWSLRDLPFVAGAAQVAASQITTWTNVVGQWSNAGGSWYQLDSGKMRGVVLVKASDSVSAETIIATDAFDNKPRFAVPIFSAGIKPAWVRKEGIVDVEAWRYLEPSAVIPIFRNFSDAVSLMIRQAGRTTHNSTLTWTDYQTLDPDVDVKADVREGGRSLALEFRVEDEGDFELSGYDFNFIGLSR